MIFLTNLRYHLHSCFNLFIENYFDTNKLALIDAWTISDLVAWAYQVLSVCHLSGTQVSSVRRHVDDLNRAVHAAPWPFQTAHKPPGGPCMGLVLHKCGLRTLDKRLLPVLVLPGIPAE